MLLKSHRVATADEPVPTALKKYRLVGQLAKGGMAELFLARANGLGGFERLLVIKRILPELAHDTEYVRMLLDEARTAATLRHSNIVQVFDVDMVDGNVFYAMEYLHGHHVQALIERARATATKVPLANAISIAVAVAAGLHYAHERWDENGKPLGIVHRDVAPNNVVVTYDGNVKLIDFGIAKSVNNLSSTRFGVFKGKLPYASPEQCRCEPVDRRTDIYSLGVLLYELTTGFPLFVGDSEFELIQRMIEAVVPRPRLRDKAYPRELEHIVLKALARDPAERYQTAEALQRDLEVFAGKARLDLSAFALSRLMGSLFESELASWQTAQDKGLTLEQHVTNTTREPKGVEPDAAAPKTNTAWSFDGDKVHTEAAAPASLARKRLASRRLLVQAAIAVALVAIGALAGRLAGSSGDTQVAASAGPIAPAIAPRPTVVPIELPPIATPEPPPIEAPEPPPSVAEVESPPPKPAKKRMVKRVPSAKRAASPAKPSPALDDDTLDAIVPRKETR